jgi:hypothetical protein
MRTSGGRRAPFGDDPKRLPENESQHVTKFLGFEFNYIDAIASKKGRLMSYSGIRESHD